MGLWMQARRFDSGGWFQQGRTLLNAVEASTNKSPGERGRTRRPLHGGLQLNSPGTLVVPTKLCIYSVPGLI